MTSYTPRPVAFSDLTVGRLGKRVTVGDGSSDGYLLGRLVEIRHRFAADGSTTETRIKIKVFEGDPGVVTLTLGPDMRLQWAS
jgi:hypothetical protein